MTLRRKVLLVAVVAGLWLPTGCQVVDPAERLGDQLDDIFRDDRLHDLPG